VTFPRTGPGFSNEPTFYMGSLPTPERLTLDRIVYNSDTGMLRVELDESIDGAEYDLFRIDPTGQHLDELLESIRGHGASIRFSVSVNIFDDPDFFMRVRRDDPAP